MASSKGVRAGRAYVELFADNSQLIRGLRNAQKRLNAFGGMVRNAGIGLIAAGSAVVAPILAASKVFASTGDRLAKMSRRTGIAVETLSELEVAADLSGSSVENLEKGIRRMQKSINDAGKGLSTPNDALEQLGLTVKQLDGLSPERQFETLADAISKVEDPTKRAALAQDLFGRAGTELIPLMEKGAAGMRELRQEAERLGLVLSKEDAVAAEELTDAMSRIKFAARGIMQTIGAAVAGPLTKFLNTSSKIIARVVAWVNDNRELVRTVLAVGVGIVAAGGAVVTLGIGIQGLAFAIGGLLKVFALFNIVVKASAALLAALTSPIGLVLAAGALLLAMFVDWRKVATATVDFLAQKFGVLKDIFDQTIGGMRDALASGDLALAARIAWLGIKLAWMEGTQELRELWETTKAKVLTSVSNLGFGMADVLNSAWAAIKSGWVETSAFLQSNMAKLTSTVKSLWSEVTEGVSNAVLVATATAQGKSQAEIDKLLELNAQKTAFDKERAGQQESADLSRIEAERKAATGRIETERDAMAEAITNAAAEAQSKRQAEAKAGIEATRKALGDARDEFAAALAAARNGGAGAGNPGNGPYTSEFDAPGAAAGVAAGPSRGLFNVSALQSLVGGDMGPAKETARNTKEAAQGTNELVRMARARGILVLPGR